MNSFPKKKKKSQNLSKVISDPHISKSASTLKKSLLTSRSEVIDSKSSSKKISKLDGYKSINSINLQIPYLQSPNSVSISSIHAKSPGKKKSASIKGFSSKLNLNSQKLGNSKKNSEKRKNSQEKSEGTLNEIDVLNKELKKELEKNKMLKEKLSQEIGKDDIFDELMTNFKARLYKLLYN